MSTSVLFNYCGMPELRVVRFFHFFMANANMQTHVCVCVCVCVCVSVCVCALCLLGGREDKLQRPWAADFNFFSPTTRSSSSKRRLFMLVSDCISHHLM